MIIKIEINVSVIWEPFDLVSIRFGDGERVEDFTPDSCYTSANSWRVRTFFPLKVSQLFIDFPRRMG